MHGLKNVCLFAKLRNNINLPLPTVIMVLVNNWFKFQPAALNHQLHVNYRDLRYLNHY